MDGSPPNLPAIAPPLTRENRRDWLRLIRSRRVGPVTFWRLMSEHGSAAAALDALPGIAAATGISDYSPATIASAEAEIAAAHAAGARALFFGAPDYPQALADLPDAPPVLWARGDPEHAARPMVALVGARNASSLGTRMASRLAQGLSDAGFAVVSGLARGIDAAAHGATLDGGGSTVAVMAGGVDVIYPAENAALMARIAKGGLCLSEQPMGLAPLARHFPLRNRIVSGLCRAVVVVEAAARSGSLITARAALDQGREVFAVPGHPFDARASGCNMLIRDGATLVRGPDDVLAALGASLLTDTGKTAVSPSVPVSDTPARSQSEGDLCDLILDLVGPSPVAEDQVLRDLGLPQTEVAPALIALELEGRLHRLPGGLLARG
ncbi:MAG: DNA-processing protein DprA [Paracoccaceae bacterium]